MKIRPNRRSYSRFPSASVVLEFRIRSGGAALLLRRPRRRSLRRRLLGACVSPIRGCARNASMPIRFAHAAPNFIRRDQQRRSRPRAAYAPPFHAPTPAIRSTPESRPAASRLRSTHSIARVFHFSLPLPGASRSCSRNSTTRLLTTAERYRAVDRISSIGCTSLVAVFRGNRRAIDPGVFPVSIASVSASRTGIGATLPKRDPHVLHRSLLHARQRGDAHFRNRLRVARPHFARVGAYPPNRRGRHTARISSSAASCIFLYPV